MTFQAILAKIEALLGNAESHAKAIVERDNKITSLTEANAPASKQIEALNGQLSSLKSEKDAAEAKAQASAGEIQAAVEAKAKAEADAKTASDELEKLKANPSLQAQAVLASVGHAPVAAGNGASASTEKPKSNLTGFARVQAALKADRTIS